MQDRTLIIISFLGSLAGLFALFLLSENIDYSEPSIEKIRNERILDMVKLEGEVMSVSALDNITFLSLVQPSSIEVIVFDPLNISKGERVEIIGKGEEYNGEMEVIAHRIRVIE
jgi:DNA/RNA endonuclease YhcR with UshA esterase domain